MNSISDNFACMYSSLISRFVFFDDLHSQIIKRNSPKTSVKNSSAQWAIFFKLPSPSPCGILKQFPVIAISPPSQKPNGPTLK